jgi:hypothetical protein
LPYSVITFLQKIMLIISSREFRNNQKRYFNILDANVQVIVKRGKDLQVTLLKLPAFVLTT